MTFSSDNWLIWASKFVPENRREWLAAMRAEYLSIKDAKARQKFARGCFMAVLGEWARSRRGLQGLARAGGAACLILMSLFGLYSARKMGLDTAQDMSAYAGIISAMCFGYLGVAGLLLTSLRATRLVALGGFLMAVFALVYIQLSSPAVDGVSQAFMSALSFETAGLMMGLFLATLYLNWLYDPEAQVI